jgi:hypothetical protein
LSRLQIVVMLVATINVIVVLEVVRRRRIRESLALLWLGVGVAGFAIASGRVVVDRVARSVGIAFGTSLVFSAAILFLLYLCLLLSIHISRLQEDIEILAEEVASLRGVTEPPAGGASESETAE